MEYIPRKIEQPLADYLSDDLPRGAIVAGIVGVGKTTLVNQVLKGLSSRFEVFTYSGDDIQFRRAVAEDSRYLIRTVRSRTNERVVIFVDEIQKTPEILDALKLAHDEENMSFIVSGSEPGYLLEEARRRLQRRAKAFSLYPFGLNEIYSHRGLCERISFDPWNAVLEGEPPDGLLKRKGDWDSIRENFASLRSTGTIPLVFREKTLARKRQSLANIIDRSYHPTVGLSQEEFDIIQTELASLNNREFTYKTIFNKTRLTRREKINAATDFLESQGLLSKKRRRIFEEARTSYHVVYSFVDAGLATYLQQKDLDSLPHDGFDLESLVFSQLINLSNASAFPLRISYYTPYKVTPSGQIKYRDGEVDFLVETGQRMIPMEVKATNDLNRINTRELTNLMKVKGLPFGIIFYQGAPWKDRSTNIYYLPLAYL